MAAVVVVVEDDPVARAAQIAAHEVAPDGVAAQHIHRDQNRVDDPSLSPSHQSVHTAVQNRSEYYIIPNKINDSFYDSYSIS